MGLRFSISLLPICPMESGENGNTFDSENFGFFMKLKIFVLKAKKTTILSYRKSCHVNTNYSFAGFFSSLALWSNNGFGFLSYNLALPWAYNFSS